ncbi:YdeI/OmpD-associated family protein [Gemmatimonas sp.]|uniref:YdeI/OmpD-associated family protein n=1 Tax=Gemmatimonas sp. TaxID=1962908 RepID=UPI00286CFD54|nr:YdeI/OmpD-associated family protein [Gemmatimonas sp.]
MSSRDPRIDAYIAKSAPFAQPILEHIREVVHETCPDVEETIKWGFPHFDYHGMMCSSASFKAHCALNFWLGRQVLGDEMTDEAMGQFGRITSIKDLPNKTTLKKYIKKAMALNDAGVKLARPATKKGAAPKPVVVPPELAAALARHEGAKVAFDAFSPSHKREYCEWIAEAKRDETKAKRVEQAIEMLAEGKARNWKYGA